MKYLVFPYNIDCENIVVPAVAEKIFGKELLSVVRSPKPGIAMAVLNDSNATEITDIWVYMPPTSGASELISAAALVQAWQGGLETEFSIRFNIKLGWMTIGIDLLSTAADGIPDVRTFSTVALEDDGTLYHFMNYNQY